MIGDLMIKNFFVAILLFSLHIFAPSMSAHAQEFPYVGYTISAREPPPGWAFRSGGLIDRNECCYEIFVRDRKVVVAITKPATRNERGGVETTNILNYTILDLPFGEGIKFDCKRKGVVSAGVLFFISTTYKFIKSVIVEKNDIKYSKWYYSGEHPCESDVD
jgi:hypothetical protein